MYSYQHRYHAGSFADIHKHLILFAILEALQKKDSPFCAVDAFAGEGVYDLTCPEALKTREFELGYHGPLALDIPDLQKLTRLAARYRDSGFHTPYPGSPAIMASMLRPQDQAIFIENHPQAFEVLSRHFTAPQIKVQKKDAYAALDALFPLRQSRGLVLVDPSYEVKDEYAWVPEALKKALFKYRQGIYMVWYPLLKEGFHLQLVQDMKDLGCPNVWVSETHLFDPSEVRGMYGSGVLVLNMPFEAQSFVMPRLKDLMPPAKSS